MLSVGDTGTYLSGEDSVLGGACTEARTPMLSVGDTGFLSAATTQNQTGS